MKKLYIFAAMMAGSLSAAAQDAYDAANFTQQDLNGTARYVGMGGALDALHVSTHSIMFYDRGHVRQQQPSRQSFKQGQG